MLPQRKHPRLKTYDYSSPGAYFITICTQDKRSLLSTVGRGLAPAEKAKHPTAVSIKLTDYGKIAEQELKNISLRYEYATVTHSVIMPNHIHFILELKRNAAAPRHRPTIVDIICAYKSIVSKRVKEKGYSDKIFQTSFYEHIIRNREDYDETVKYINDNPDNWYYDDLYS